jgi:hypothetical protein
MPIANTNSEGYLLLYSSTFICATYYYVLKLRTKYFKDSVLQLSFITPVADSNLESIMSAQIFLELLIVYVKLKVEQSHHRPGQTQSGSRRFRLPDSMTVGT